MSDAQKNQGLDNLKMLMMQKNASWLNFFRSWFQNPVYIVTVISNLAIFFLPGLSLKIHSVSIIWIYLVQSLMIGFVHVLKLSFYRFAPPSRPTDWKNPRAIAIFFLFHFGFFHFVYAFFINPFMADWTIVTEGAAIFGFALILNTLRNFSQENSGKYNANDFMFLPYVRIIPIHIAIILGSFISGLTGSFGGVVIVLMVLKTVMELFLEYLQQLGVSFAQLQEISKDN